MVAHGSHDLLVGIISAEETSAKDMGPFLDGVERITSALRGFALR